MRQNFRKSNKTSAYRMFYANNISAGSYVRDIKLRIMITIPYIVTKAMSLGDSLI